MSIPLQKIFEAERKAKEIIKEAESSAKKIEQDARKKAEKLLDDTRAKCLTLNDECQTEADKEAEQHRSELQGKLDALSQSWDETLKKKRASLIGRVIEMVLKRSPSND